ncbi:hypothetical protein [Colwellia sp. 20A7]|uniref:hypothetical protein n=1 Tax=Colwellia sp. 20A7 TaxID=2689569 RepID=UPI00135A8C98|nr:hypothetical protein [Colwellia sp. 20A7]
MQKLVVVTCSIAALIGFGLWFRSEPSFEPAIGLIAAIGGLAHSYWPNVTKKYTSKRLKGRQSFDYSNNNGLFIVGSDALKFETKWSKASGDSIHIYNDPASIEGVALVKGIPAINMISNAAKYDFSSRSRTPQEGDIIVLKNSFGNFAVIKVVDIKDSTRSDDTDELTIEYVINPDKKVDFT